MAAVRLESALPVGVDARERARALSAVHSSVVAEGLGRAAGADRAGRGVLRPVIEDSWRRVMGAGVDPDSGGTAEPLDAESLQAERAGSGLGPAIATLREGLTRIADAALHIMVVVGADGRVLWREGSTAVRLRADRLGFVEGAAWDERTVGTNAIGTALVARRPVQVYSAEHFVRSHHAWTCAAAPLTDPRSGRLLGVVDVSGPAATVHASTLALVDAVAHLAETDLRGHHLRDLDRLRTVAAPLLARIDGPAMVTDPHGWLAASIGLAPPDRLMLPDRVEPGTAWLPALGTCRVEPVPGGWLIRVQPDGETPPTRVVLDLRSSRSRLSVTSASGEWERTLSPRHAELLAVLACHPTGLTAAELGAELAGDGARTVTVRAEFSRLRRHLGALLAAQPYRFADWVEVEVRWPDDATRLLPHSPAPSLRRIRAPRDQGR